MGETGTPAERSRIRKQVKKALKPLHDQRNDFTGCAIVLFPAGAAFFAALQLDFSGWGASGVAFVVLIVFAAIFGSRDERQKATAADQSLDLFDRAFPHGDESRTIAIDVLKQMATTEKYDFKEDASRLLQELGIEGLPEQSADGAVADALGELDGDPAAQQTPTQSPLPQEKNPARAEASASPAIEIEPQTPSAPAPRTQGIAGSRRNRHIPLEPEDPDT